MMTMPSIALPTGPYDWHAEALPRAVFDARLARFRDVMQRRGATHAVVHGNGFDHAALHWLTHFTPKLGPAYALVPRNGPLRMLFAGGPGMKPSAQRLTWVEDVVAVKSAGADVKRWLGEAKEDGAISLGLVEGRAMLLGDWRAMNEAAGVAAVELDADVGPLVESADRAQREATSRAQTVIAAAQRVLETVSRSAVDLCAAIIEAERAAYAAGAEDVRVKAGRRAEGPPTALPDTAMPIAGGLRVIFAVRCGGQWAQAETTIAR